MKYEEIRDQIRSGDVLAWSHRGWKTWYDFKIQMVRAFTRSEYSHVGIAWRVGGRVFIIEAVNPKVRIYPLSKEIPFYWTRTGEETWSLEQEEFLLGVVGDSYSNEDAVKAFFDGLIVGSNNSWQCAELVNKYLVNAKLFNEGEVKSTPSAVVDALLDKGLSLTKVTI